MIDARLITTAQELPGYRLTRNLGVVRGIIVRSRSVVGNIAAGVTEVLAYGTAVYIEVFRG